MKKNCHFVQNFKTFYSLTKGEFMKFKSDEVVKGTTCFKVLKDNNVNCQRKSCPSWIQHESGNNCSLISASEGPYTLQEIGKIYGLTRMRICQIEKEILEKAKRLCD